MSLKDDLQKAQAVDVDALCLQLGLTTALSREFLRYSLANAVLFDKKNNDYGPKNISGWGTFGCVVRAGDKFSRLQHLFKKKKKASNEPIEDSFRDVSNYMLIALMVEGGIWPE